MHIAEIVPLSCLELTKDNKYHMCLAQLALVNSEYGSFYRRMSDEGKYVIMDNGAAEGECLTEDELIKAYELVHPTEIILPDVLRDAEKTFEKTVHFFESKWGKVFYYNRMVVPQGRNLEEWIECLHRLANEMPFECVGVPKWLGQNSLDRLRAVEYLAKYDVEVHLLGCNETPGVIEKCGVSNKNVRSCDSAFAYLCAKSEYEHIDKTTTRPSGKILFLSDPLEDNLEVLMSDFEKAAGVINNKEA